MQKTTALSTAEAEYCAALTAGSEVLYLHKLLNRMGFAQVSSSLVYEDNTACIEWGNNVISGRGCPRWSQRHVIGGPVQGKPANDESLARDESGCSNQQLQGATYKTVQERQLHMTLATATFFPVHVCSCAQDRRAPKGSARAPTTLKLQEYH
jgi:hypothetical protein